MIPRFLAALMLTILMLAPMQAWAECAWVLWRAVSEAGAVEWHLHRASASLAMCKNDLRAAILHHESTLRQQLPGIVDRYKVSEETIVINLAGAVTKVMVVDYKCLPDTIDPRGPKGGGR